MDPESLELFAASLGRDDQVALEVSGNAWEVVRIIRPHVGRIVAASPTDTGMRQARAKTDRLDARALARLLASGQLETVWVPDEATQAMRRRLQRRSQLVRTKSAAKNEIHAALMRRLVPKPGFSDLFGKAGRAVAGRARAAGGRARVGRQARCARSSSASPRSPRSRQLVAAEALGSAEIRRLMSVPGVGAITAAAFMAAVGEIGRFPSAEEARRLSRPRSDRPPVGLERGQLRADLKAGLGRRPLRPGRGLLERGQGAGAVARLL